jgi:hypothetical protein
MGVISNQHNESNTTSNKNYKQALLENLQLNPSSHRRGEASQKSKQTEHAKLQKRTRRRAKIKQQNKIDVSKENISPDEHPQTKERTRSKKFCENKKPKKDTSNALREISETEISQRSKRSRKVVCYKEPSLKSKMRKGYKGSFGDDWEKKTRTKKV